MTGAALSTPQHVTLRRLSVAAAVWALAYAAYRGYYAAGGTAALPGTLSDAREFRHVNLVGATVIGLLAALPLALLPLWRRPRTRTALLTVCWVIAVGACMHATVDMISRVLSLAGLVSIHYPASVWRSVDHHAADLQDLLGNEPWFLLEGLAFAALAWIAMDGAPRRRWMLGATAAVVALTALGLLTATGATGRVIAG